MQVGPERRLVHAREATSADRERLWALLNSTFSGYDGYQQKVRRQIAVVELLPR